MMEPRQSTTVPKVSKTSALGMTVAPDANLGRAATVSPALMLFNACRRFILGELYLLQLSFAIMQGIPQEGTMRRVIALLVFCFAAMCLTANAQWLRYPDPKIPRTADGKPNLKAPAPKLPGGTPDFSGIWAAPNGKYLENLAADGVEVLMQPWAEQLYKERLANDAKDRPSGRCLPHSVTDYDGHFTPRKIVQTPGLLIMLFESYHAYRQIFTDGRPLPEDRDPAWYGYSVGKWDGDTLVVDTVGVNEKTWLDDSGHPHSDALHIIERF